MSILYDFKSILPNYYPINEQYAKFEVSDNYQHNRGRENIYIFIIPKVCLM